MLFIPIRRKGRGLKEKKMVLPEDCTVEDAQEADVETVYYSLNTSLFEYSDDVIYEMARMLCLHGI